MGINLLVHYNNLIGSDLVAIAKVEELLVMILLAITNLCMMSRKILMDFLYLFW
jgi:hypothetical protein